MIEIHEHKRWKLPCFLLGIASLLFFTACGSEFSLWVMPNSTISNLVFGVSSYSPINQKMRVSSIGVYSCDVVREGHYPNPVYAVWYARTRNIENQGETDRVYYGKDPDGLETIRGAEPLKAPGCYVVLAYARNSKGYMEDASTAFNINAEGQVIQMSNSEQKDLFTK